jgi:hypothetical protein
MLLPEREVVGTAPTPVPTAELEARIAAALQWCARVRGKTEAQWYVGVDGFDIDELIQLLSGLSSPWLGKKCSDCSATGVCEEEDDVRDACHKIKVKP